MQTRIITGKFCKATREMKRPDNGYDSAVNDVEDPKIYIVFDDASAYPEYIIVFKAGC